MTREQLHEDLRALVERWSSHSNGAVRGAGFTKHAERCSRSMSREIERRARQLGTYYVIGRAMNTSRARIDGGGRTVTVYVPDDRYGKHMRNVDCKRAYMEALEPDLAGAPDPFIRDHFDRWSRNVRAVKVIRVVETIDPYDLRPIE